MRPKKLINRQFRLAEGGNLNSYAGAVDPDLLIEMPIAPAATYSSLEEEVSKNILEMHHNEAPMTLSVTADCSRCEGRFFGI